MRRLTVMTEHGESAVGLPSGEFSLGRSSSADIHVNDPHVSGKHVQLRVTDDGVTVTNLSRFGSVLQGNPVTEAVDWPQNIPLQLARTVTLRWEVADDDSKLPLPHVGTRQGLAGSASDDTNATRAQEFPSEGIDDPPAQARTPAGKTDGGEEDVQSNAAVSDISGHQTAPPSSGSGPFDDGDDATNADPAMDHDATSMHAVDFDDRRNTDHAKGESSAGKFDDFITDAVDDGDTSALEEDDATRELHTRGVDDADIDRLRQLNRKSRRRRLGVSGVAVVVLLSFGAYLRPRSLPPETEVAWPEDAHGQMMELFFDAPMGGYDLIVPDASTRVVRQEEGLLLIRCDIGRDADIPFYVLIEEREVERYWELTLADLVQQWIDAKRNDEESWLFDEPSLEGLFMGGRGGFPFAFVRYTRRDARGREWAGSARLFRHGPRFSTVQTEAPLAARSRTDSMLSRFYVHVPKNYVDSSWEPVLDAAGGSAVGRLREARRMGVERDAPTHWPDVILAFREALTMAAADGDGATLNEATRELMEFRDKQQVFYNKLYIGFLDAVQRNDLQSARMIKQMGEAAFALPEDARFRHVRNNWRLP